MIRRRQCAFRFDKPWRRRGQCCSFSLHISSQDSTRRGGVRCTRGSIASAVAYGRDWAPRVESRSARFRMRPSDSLALHWTQLSSHSCNRCRSHRPPSPPSLPSPPPPPPPLSPVSPPPAPPLHLRNRSLSLRRSHRHRQCQLAAPSNAPNARRCDTAIATVSASWQRLLTHLTHLTLSVSLLAAGTAFRQRFRGEALEALEALARRHGRDDVRCLADARARESVSVVESGVECVVYRERDLCKVQILQTPSAHKTPKIWIRPSRISEMGLVIGHGH